MKNSLNVDSQIQIIFLTVIAIWLLLLLPLFVLHHFDNDYAGTLGDTLGLTNSLFSSLAFAGTIYSIMQQNKAIAKQEEQIRQEKLDREEEMRRQAIQIENERKYRQQAIDQQQKQIDNERTERQLERFEGIFFQMLKTQREITREIEIAKTQKNRTTGQINTIRTIKGSDCFKTFYETYFQADLVECIIELYGSGSLKKNSTLKGRLTLLQVVAIYEELYFKKYQRYLGHYFRHLYHTTLLVHETTFLEDKTKYTRLIRAQLSTYEMMLLFYNGLSEYGEKFKPLIEEYSLLKGIDFELLINEDNDKYSTDGFDVNAFGEVKHNI